MPYQRTIARKTSCTGIGIHSGAPVDLSLSPAAVNEGIVFVRREGDRRVEIPARPEFVSSTTNATSLARNGVEVSTVEHLLAALRGLGVDNVLVEVAGTELPVMDGSASSFVYLLCSAGIVTQAEPRQVIVVRRPISYGDGLRKIEALPAARGFEVEYAIDFEHPAIGRQTLHVPDLTPTVFVQELAGARTFGFFEQLGALRRAGLAGGASLENTIVLDDRAVMNPGGLRWPDELVRHKVLDLVGDLALLGHAIRGSVRVERGGHALHRALVDAFVQNPESWRIVEETAPLELAPPLPADFLAPI